MIGAAAGAVGVVAVAVAVAVGLGEIPEGMEGEVEGTEVEVEVEGTEVEVEVEGTEVEVEVEGAGAVVNAKWQPKRIQRSIPQSDGEDLNSRTVLENNMNSRN